MAVMLKSGVPLSQGLELLAENMTNKKFGACIFDISKQLNSGEELSSCLSSYPRIFAPITVGLIEAGEAGGILSEVLERLALLLEAKSKIKGQITGALIYPVAVLVLAVTISLALLIFIVPTFDEMFASMGAELPALTGFMLTLSRVVTSINFALGAPIIIFILIYLFRTNYSSQSGKELIKNSLRRSISLVTQGQELSSSLQNSKVIPRLLVSMIKIGEETGALSFMLENLSNFYKREVEEAVTVLTKAMEPTVIFVVAAIVGTIVISLYLPMFDLINQMG